MQNVYCDKFGTRTNFSDSRPSQDLRPSNYVEDVSVKVTRVECKDEVRRSDI